MGEITQDEMFEFSSLPKDVREYLLDAAALEAFSIVRLLAFSEPIDSEFSYCLFCGEGGLFVIDWEHESDCLISRARRWTEQEQGSG